MTGKACHMRWTAYGRPQGKGGKKEKFTAQFHQINPGMLRTAFYALSVTRPPAQMGRLGELMKQTSINGSRIPAQSGSTGGVSCPAVAANVYTEARRAAAAACDCRP